MKKLTSDQKETLLTIIGTLCAVGVALIKSEKVKNRVFNFNNDEEEQ